MIEAAPAAQRRLAGEPKAKPDAPLPRSEIRKFLPAGRFIRAFLISFEYCSLRSQTFTQVLQLSDLGRIGVPPIPDKLSPVDSEKTHMSRFSGLSASYKNKRINSYENDICSIRPLGNLSATKT